MMIKKILFVIIATIISSVSMMAQRISVVTEDGETSMYNTLEDAVAGAEIGSTIYLPGGRFGSGSTIGITKRLTIVGIGHKTKTENPDGHTFIQGNLSFLPGSDGSAIMGCFVSGTIYIGTTNSNGAVNNIIIKYNYIWAISIHNSLWGTTICQNSVDYISSSNTNINFGINVTNNIIKGVQFINDGFISNNIIYGHAGNTSSYGSIRNCVRTSITNNIIFNGIEKTCSDCYASGNMMTEDYGEGCIVVGGEEFDWGNVFVRFDGPNTDASNFDFHFKPEYQQYSDCGIYGGTGFNEDQLPPIPYIVSKIIPEQTDAAGKLNIKIRVKAGD